MPERQENGTDDAPETPAPTPPEGAHDAEPGAAPPTGPPGPEDPAPDDAAPVRPYSIWSPMATDLSDVERPDPERVSLLPATLLLLLPIVVLGLGAILVPRVVWDRFLDPYIWTPIVTDAGFNVVNTVSWVILLGLLLFFAVRLTQKIDQPVDFALVLAVVPYMMGGSIARVLEDTGYFSEPLRFFFITPIIYVVIFFVAIAWLALGHVLARQAQRVGNERALYALAGILFVVWTAYTAWSLYGDHLSQYGHPVVLLAALAIPFAYLWNTTKQTGRLSKVGVMATFGTGFLLFMIYMLVVWHVGGPWPNLIPTKAVPQDPQASYWVYPVMFLAPALVTAIVYYIARKGTGRSENLAAFLLPINLLIIYAQAKDAILTAIGIDFLGYSEKHVAPGFLIDLAENSGIPLVEAYPGSFVMIPLKLLVAILVVWLIDVYAKSDLRQTPNLVGLAKLAIIMVGLAPGTRNGVRMAMGV